MSGRPKEYDDTDVIEAAMNVFWTNGYEASSLQELCEQTGLGRGSLYHAFGSKQKLYEQALRHYHELGLEIQSVILHAPGTTKDKLRAFMLWGISQDFDSNQRRGCMALHSVLERSCKDAIVDKINQHYVVKLEKILFSIIEKGQRKKEISCGRSPVEVTRAFLAGYYGLRILGHSSPDKTFVTDAVNGIISAL